MGQAPIRQGVVNIKQVAKKAGVSVATVSRVINRSGTVDADTAATVWKVVKELDYKPNLAARHMKGHLTGCIGLLVPDIESPFFASIAAGALAEAQKHDQVMIISNAEGNRSMEVTAIDALSRSVIDGLIYIPVSTGDPLPEVERFRHLPVVVVGRRGIFKDRPHVYVDNVKGGYIATKYLLALGRRRIAFIAGFWDPPCSRETILDTLEREDVGAFTTLDRFQGYIKALKEGGLPFDPELIAIVGYDYKAGYNGAAELIGRLVNIDGILAANDLVAAGAVSFLRDQGIKVPTDISVIGYDDGTGATLSYPRLTSVRQDARKLGKSAVEVMNRLLMKEKSGEVNGEFEIKDVVVDVSLTIRGSTAARPGAFGLRPNGTDQKLSKEFY
ncbi:MAG TPA: LacI family DNA-binding transcriptional regulator [Bacillota bacterium]